ncbi:serine/threonine protein kinase [Pelotomaculum thermopropionicum SI]|uniref:non-specific serine/threonine protein kinase n=1 Tax=Pelotomaculum thermopropionicum (strain DSM 13744 / JCM 10971 / SI) TaxID=370438 RepID=A5D1B0_PELTS|nr:serine/threonine protein kinase [Pelotomaculum thermopropionicum SI]
MIGKLLGNRYEILEQLGGGGMAIIYKGRDTFLNRLVTVKVLRPEFTCDEDFVRRFRREAQAVASLSHPNIVSIYDVGREDKTHYLVMEYVEGDNLKNLIRGQGRLQPGRAVEIARQISEALQHAHENQIVHRDVKPQNILITRWGRAKLTDFGIAREATAATLTQTDTVLGSVHYLSPEQARGETAGPQSDIYSLGVVLYEMVTGVLPFQGETPIAVALKHIQEEPARPSFVNPSVPPGLEKIICRAMAKVPHERYQSAGDMAADLESLYATVAGEINRAVPVDEFATRVISPVRPAEEEIKTQAGGRRVKRRRPGWLWAALIVLCLVGVSLAAFQYYVNVPETTVPDVEGMTLEEAQGILQKQGFKNIQVTRSYHPSVPQGRVISQDPPPETKVKVTRTIALSVSQGPEYRTVPDVIGLQLKDARIKISQSELNVADVQERFSDRLQGEVLDQDPKPGARLSKGSGVILYVSKGQQPVTCQVPDLTGLTLDRARAELERVKLKLDENVGRATSTDYLPGQVISQNPAKGMEVQEGSSVQVTISNGPGPARRLARVEAKIPDDKKEHELRIVVKDVQGSSEAYINTHPPGETVIKEVPYYGKAVIQVYIDKKLVGEKSVE